MLTSQEIRQCSRRKRSFPLTPRRRLDWQRQSQPSGWLRSPSLARLLTFKSARHARRPFSSATAWPHDIRYTTGATPKSNCIGPAWPNMANKNDRQKRGLGAGVSAVFGLRANATHSAPRCLHKARLSRWRSDHEKARYTWDYRWGRNVDCGAPLASMVAKESVAIARQR